MRAPELPADEVSRLQELRSLGILDTDAEERFDRITRLAQRMFGVSTAMVTLVDEDRQWFKSRIGLEVAETPRAISFCGHAILQDDIMMVPDALMDERFSDNPLVVGDPGVRFYAGCPIVGPGGSTLGTLCLVDQQPRELSRDEMDSLRDLAEMVESQIATNALAVTDALTGLGNRRGFMSVASVVLDINRRRGLDSAILYFDLDKFKSINDRFGHAQGDAALRHFADVLRRVIRASDVIARLGGDEFVALLSGSADPQKSVERIERALEELNASGVHPFRLTTSIGVAVTERGTDESLDSLVTRADTAMYAHKHRPL